MWQIGDGEEGRIFEDSWIAKKPRHKLDCPNEGGSTPDLRVNELVGQNGRKT